MRTLLVILTLSSQLIWAALEFESKLVEVHTAADAQKATIDFKFSNIGEEPVFISHIDPDCDCLTIQAAGGTTLPDKRIRYRPGESGTIRSTFKIGNNKGQIDQKVLVWLTGDPKDKPSIQLHARIHVPEVITMTPRSLKWDLGSKPLRQSIEVVMHHRQAIHVTETNSTNVNFQLELEPIENGKRYLIWVTPKSTERPGIAVIEVNTDSPVKNQKTQQVFAMVQRPKAE